MILCDCLCKDVASSLKAFFSARLPARLNKINYDRKAKAMQNPSIRRHDAFMCISTPEERGNYKGSEFSSDPSQKLGTIGVPCYRSQGPTRGVGYLRWDILFEWQLRFNRYGRVLGAIKLRIMVPISWPWALNGPHVLEITDFCNSRFGKSSPKLDVSGLPAAPSLCQRLRICPDCLLLFRWKKF